VARLSPYHFARQFKKATGLPPHQYAILRRVERAKQLLQAGTGLSLAEVAARVEFSDQSQLCRHLKRLISVKPGQFRPPARTAEQAARPAKKPDGEPLTIAHERGRSAWSRRGPGAIPRPRPPRSGRRSTRITRMRTMVKTSNGQDRRPGPPPVGGAGFPRLVVLLGLGAGSLAALTAAQAQAGRSPAAVSPAPRKERLQAARRFYERRCSSCHDDDGTGGALRPSLPQIPDFTSRGWQARRDDTQLVVSILEGRGTRMPAFHGKLSEDAAQDLVGLIRTFDPTYDPAAAGRPPLTAEEFGRRFRQLDAEMEELKRQFRGGAARPAGPP
jgi:mono/diheme cytochrome c family protein